VIAAQHHIAKMEPPGAQSEARSNKQIIQQNKLMENRETKNKPTERLLRLGTLANNKKSETFCSDGAATSAAFQHVIAARMTGRVSISIC
jgi:hypothetical protein